jgi:hypothetical protein
MYATTSKFATLTGVTAKALHLYERRGLLKRGARAPGIGATAIPTCCGSKGSWR